MTTRVFALTREQRHAIASHYERHGARSVALALVVPAGLLAAALGLLVAGEIGAAVGPLLLAPVAFVLIYPVFSVGALPDETAVVRAIGRIQVRSSSDGDVETWSLDVDGRTIDLKNVVPPAGDLGGVEFTQLSQYPVAFFDKQGNVVWTLPGYAPVPADTMDATA